MNTTESKKKYRLWRWMSLLMLLTLSLTNISTAQAQWKSLPQGQTITASEDMVVGNKETLQTTVELIKTTKAERNAWKDAYKNVSADIAFLTSSMDIQLQELETQINKERKAHKQVTTKKSLTFLVIGVLVGGLIASN